jgi:hypothetical protein
MNTTLAALLATALFLVLGVTSSYAKQPGTKKLQVFILAGQSNMVGHASYVTLPALLTAKEPGIERVRDLVFKKGALAYLYYAVDAYELFRKGWVKHLHEFSLIGSDRPYHYMGSGKFFVRFGDALADSMVGLMVGLMTEK